MDPLEEHFKPFRANIAGIDQTFASAYGEKRLVYADWTASGRLYSPIEEKIHRDLGPFVGNTHSESSVTGTSMTRAYHLAHQLIKRHVNAGPNDALLFVGAGMTSAINKLQRILGLRVPEQLRPYLRIPDEVRPVVFVTHMEHHSNQTTWYETIADVHVIKPTRSGRVDLDDLSDLLERNRHRPVKIGSFTACSNVTGIPTPYRSMARLMHAHGGLCFVDFAASAPYAAIDMHPADREERLDAITFSPHKFLGGPGSPGVLIFDSSLYTLKSPDQPGGGTVLWTNPWGKYAFIPDVEAREDGGTPAFLQAIKAALAVQLKEQMGLDEIRKREERLVSRLFAGLRSIPNLHILAEGIEDRLGIFSFYLDGVHYNLAVKLLNDRFGIQVRGGCSCAGTYGHYLLHVDQYQSKRITDEIDAGNLSHKPGWVRLSVHPTMLDDEVEFAIDAVRQVQAHAAEWSRDYRHDPQTNEFRHVSGDDPMRNRVESWFLSPRESLLTA